MFLFPRRPLPRLRMAAMLAMALTGFARSAAAQAPRIDTGVISSFSTTGLVTNAYPVIARMSTGRLVCVFAGISEAKPPNMQIVVSVSDDNGLHWSSPQSLFDHPDADDGDPNLLVDGDRILAFSTTVHKPVTIDSSDIYIRSSTDGLHWSPEQQMDKPHRYICGKIHQGHRLQDGTLIMGYSWDTWAERHEPATTEGQMDIKSGVLRSTDGGKTWTAGADMYVQVHKVAADAIGGLAEPATVVLADGRIMALMRTGGDKFYQSWSPDGGLHWETPAPSTLTSHNSPAALWRLDGSATLVAVWNNSPLVRDPLAAALSADGGKTWTSPRVLARTGGPQASYPSVVQAADGTIIAVWQQDMERGRGREVRIARFNKAWLMQKEP